MGSPFHLMCAVMLHKSKTCSTTCVSAICIEKRKNNNPLLLGIKRRCYANPLSILTRQLEKLEKNRLFLLLENHENKIGMTEFCFKNLGASVLG